MLCRSHAMPQPCRSESDLKATAQLGMGTAWYVWISIDRPETAYGRPAGVRLLPTTTRSSAKVIRGIPISVAVRIFPATTRTFAKDMPLSGNGSGAAWHVWIGVKFAALSRRRTSAFGSGNHFGCRLFRIFTADTLEGMCRILNKCLFIAVYFKTARRCSWTAVSRFCRWCWFTLTAQTSVSKITQTVLFSSKWEGLRVRCDMCWRVLCFQCVCVRAHARIF
jgi:hypothetical protein